MLIQGKFEAVIQKVLLSSKWMTHVPTNKNLEKNTAEYSSKNIPPFLYPPKPMAHGRYNFLARLTKKYDGPRHGRGAAKLAHCRLVAVLVNRR